MIDDVIYLGEPKLLWEVPLKNPANFGQAVLWCHNNLIWGSWREYGLPDHTIFSFSSNRDAILFKFEGF